jgi:hypothetical protein
VRVIYYHVDVPSLCRLVAEQEVIGEQDQMDDYLKELQAKGERR